MFRPCPIRAGVIVFGLLLAASLLVGNARAQDVKSQPEEFFEQHVRPLLVKHCYECHSAAAEGLKGGLSLDSKGGWEKGGDSGPAIVPGEPGESLLIQAVRYDGLEMPPSGKLPQADIEALIEWVRQGAFDPRGGDAVAGHEPAEIDLEAGRAFWAFQMPEAHRPPTVVDVAWPLSDIDQFILARLESNGLKPAADADRQTWLRRVTFDLAGLPPTVDELRGFLADESPLAETRMVDRLLASPQFGEHWGRHWLDVARYADTNGSDFNAVFFEAWRYRNYVVEAFNDDKPYDEFIREQIAGDLLPHNSDQQRAEQLIASGFLMVGAKMLSERDKEKLTMDVVDEQVDTIGRAFLGLTLGCARCHDHKFDPIPTEDYYALAGILRSTITLEGESQEYVSAWKNSPLPIEPAHAAALAAHAQANGELTKRLEQARGELKAAEERLAAASLRGEGVIVDDAQAKVVGKWKDSTISPHFVGKGYIHDEKEAKGEKSVTFTAELPRGGEYEVRLSYAGGGGRADNVPVEVSHAGGARTVKLDQTKTPAINKLFQPIGKFHFEQGKPATVTISTAGTVGYVIVDAVQFVAVEKEEIEQEGAEKAREEVAAARSAVDELKGSVARLEAEAKQLAAQAPPPAPVAFAAREAPQIGDCQVCIRGEVANRGQTIPRGFLRVVDDQPRQVVDKAKSGRAELAEWIARPDHPLTARVMVNRVWQHLLGEGIVRSVDNFGRLGERPTHAELLDTLAVEFVQGGWSVKDAVRRIVLSRVYRPSATSEETAAAVDSENKLLWRAHRKRLPAEALRDGMLAIAGQLDVSRGESPVAGMDPLAITNDMKQVAGANKQSALRRSLYLPLIRNDLPPFLTVFDFADPDVVTGKRAVTNVPAQALFLLNSPDVQESAAQAARRFIAISQDDGQRLDAAYEAVFARTATKEEKTRAIGYLTAVRAGRSDDDTNLAAWTRLVQAMFASTEFRMLD